MFWDKAVFSAMSFFLKQNPLFKSLFAVNSNGSRIGSRQGCFVEFLSTEKTRRYPWGIQRLVSTLKVPSPGQISISGRGGYSSQSAKLWPTFHVGRGQEGSGMSLLKSLLILVKMGQEFWKPSFLLHHVHFYFWCQCCQLSRILGQSEVSNNKNNLTIPQTGCQYFRSFILFHLSSLST